jgi:hypothetical protein
MAAVQQARAVWAGLPDNGQLRKHGAAAVYAPATAQLFGTSLSATRRGRSPTPGNELGSSQRTPAAWRGWACERRGITPAGVEPQGKRPLARWGRTESGGAPGGATMRRERADHGNARRDGKGEARRDQIGMASAEPRGRRKGQYGGNGRGQRYKGRNDSPRRERVESRAGAEEDGEAMVGKKGGGTHGYGLRARLLEFLPLFFEGKPWSIAPQ